MAVAYALGPRPRIASCSEDSVSATAAAAFWKVRVISMSRDISITGLTLAPSWNPCWTRTVVASR